MKNSLLVAIITALVAAAGVWAMREIPLDAIPDLSENQVIVYTEWPGRGPQVVEDQITYPLSTNLQGVAGIKDIRATSAFGFSLIYVIFKEDVDGYWARSRVLEKLNYAQSVLPAGVSPRLGPDGTGVGHVFWYVLKVDEGFGYDLAKLREVQDYYIRYKLQAVDGVAEIASIGGFQREYQVDLDPTRMEAYGLSVMEVTEAIARSNRDTGGGVIEQADTELMIRGRGYLRGADDLRAIVVKRDEAGTPVTLNEIAQVQLGSMHRRGMLDEGGEGEVVGGIVVMRQGENAARVIERVKAKIKELEGGLPPGVKIVPAYDRSALIMAAVDTLRDSLLEEAVVVSLIILLFLFHMRSALVVLVTLPLSVLLGFLFMYFAGISSNIMSLGGIAIAVGVIVDAAIVMVENAYKQLSEEPGGQAATEKRRREIIARSCKQVGPAIVSSMLIILASFAPIFLLEDQEGKLFRPLAWTKTLTIIGASVLAVTLVPALLLWLLKGEAKPERANPITRLTTALYLPVLRAALRWPKTTLLVNVIALLIAWPMVFGAKIDLDGDGVPEREVMALGQEFMPPLDEGSLLYMPTTLPGVSVSEAKRLLQVTDRIIASHPEVAYVLGKVGRADTATDPAPVEMLETIILLKPQEQWRPGITKKDIIGELDAMLQVPGLSNGWTQPIINRINMLSTGIRTDLGVKVFGPDLKKIGELSREIEAVLRTVAGAADLYAERPVGGRFVDIEPDREALARYGLQVEDVHAVIEGALGGMAVTQVVEGRSRFGVRVRYARDWRGSVEGLSELLVRAGEAQVPLGMLAKISVVEGPAMISSEDGELRGLVVLNVRGRDVGSFVEEASRALEDKIEKPAGYSWEWSGQWEGQQRAKKRLGVLVPAVLLIIFVFLYMTFQDVTESLLVMLSVPFAMIGGVYLLWALELKMSVAVWVGFISLFGVAVETGVVMVIYLHEALDERILEARREGREVTLEELDEATEQGAAQRLRPKLMTVTTDLIGLLPLMWATGTGADVMKPIAVPVIGGMFTSAVHVLLVTPVIFIIMKRYAIRRGTLKLSADGQAQLDHEAGREAA
jgi:Cu(I)/Ag(I) efflux system membrane protein CusA/SilA